MKMTDALLEIANEVNTPPAGEVYMDLCRAFPLEEIKTKSHYGSGLAVAKRLVDVLNSEDANNQAVSDDVSKYLAVLAGLIGLYETHHFPGVGKSSGRQVLAYLMESQGLTQSDLKKELGGQSVVSGILSGGRALNLRQVKALAARFKISPEAFIA